MQKRKARNGSTFYVCSLDELMAMSPLRPAASGDHLRLGCPFHGSDNQRSLQVRLSEERFKCFCCGAWGFIVEMSNYSHRSSASPTPPPPTPAKAECLDFRRLLEGWQQCFRESPTHNYLTSRRVSLDIAQPHGVGYCPAGEWPGRLTLKKWPRVVFPLSTPAGDIVGLYSRAVDTDYPKAKAPKAVRHDVVGRRGLFNAMEGLAKARLWGVLYVTEGCFDCLAMIEVGYPATVALIGTDGLPWQWLQGVRCLYLCLDRDQSGLAKAQCLADQAALRGISAHIPEDDEYGGYGEPSEQYEATGTITLGEDDQDLLF